MEEEKKEVIIINGSFSSLDEGNEQDGVAMEKPKDLNVFQSERVGAGSKVPGQK